jgi:peptidoglycan hydrolase CwlO-like protein
MRLKTMNNNLFTLILAFVTGGGVHAIFKWAGDRKKSKVEVESLEINNVQAAANMWKELVQELRGSLDRQDAQVVRLTKQCEFMQKELLTVQQENQALRDRLKELQEKNLYQ